MFFHSIMKTKYGFTNINKKETYTNELEKYF